MNSYRITIISLIFYSTLHSQWTSFSLSDADPARFRQQVEPLVIGTSLHLGHRPNFERNISKRLGFGVSYGSGVDLSGTGFSENPMPGFPVLHGALLVSSNLFLNGSLSGFQSGRDVIQVSGYGLHFILSDREDNYWSSSVSFSYLDGAEDLRCRTVTFDLKRNVSTLLAPIHYGFGVNLYSARILFESNDEIPDWVEGQINYLLFGTDFYVGEWTLGAQIDFHPDYLFLSVDLTTQFY